MRRLAGTRLGQWYGRDVLKRAVGEVFESARDLQGQGVRHSQTVEGRRSDTSSQQRAREQELQKVCRCRESAALPGLMA